MFRLYLLFMQIEKRTYKLIDDPLLEMCLVHFNIIDLNLHFVHTDCHVGKMASALEEPNPIQENYLERNLTILSKMFTYPEIDRIARHWLNFSDEEINDHKIEATSEDSTTSHTYTYMVLKTWCNKNKGPDLLRRLHTTLKRARDVQENAIDIWVSNHDTLEKCR